MTFLPHHRMKCGACGLRAGEHPRRVGSIQGVCSGFEPLVKEVKRPEDSRQIAEEHAVGVRGDLPSSKPADAVDRILKATACVSASYDTDARAVARVLVRHFGDEAEAIVDRLPTFIEHVRHEKVRGRKPRNK